MTVKELIELLEQLDQDLNVRVQHGDDPINYWVSDLEQHPTGSTGYPTGEVVINVSE